MVSKIGPEISVFCHLLKFASLVFLDIAQDCIEHLVELKPKKGPK